MKMSQTIKFSYLYRDAGNSKARGEVVFSNPTDLSSSEIDTRLTKAFDMGCLFIADQIQIPEVFLYSDDDVIAEDHCFHEFDSVQVSLEKATNTYQRSIESFVEQAEKESRSGWRAFNPIDKIFGRRA